MDWNSIETKFTVVDLGATALDGTIEGYASLFNIEDMGRDIVLPGAFSRSLARRGAREVKLLFQHDPGEPIGVWIDLHEDEKGLFVRGRLESGVQRSREVLSLMRSGAIDGLSIGFRAVKAVRDRRSGIRRLMEIDLWEISVVTFPMQAEARIRAVKQAATPRRLPTTREFERWLTQDAGLSRGQARTVINSGFKSLAASRDAGGAHTAEMRLAETISQAAAAMSQSIMR